MRANTSSYSSKEYLTLLQNWCNFKKDLFLEHNRRRLFIKNAEVWWVSFGVNLGVEINGKGKEYSRPALILKVYSREAALVIPLTSKDKSLSKHHKYVGEVKDKPAYAILSQARVVDTIRFQERVKRLSDKKFRSVVSAFAEYNNFCSST